MCSQAQSPSEFEYSVLGRDLRKSLQPTPDTQAMPRTASFASPLESHKKVTNAISRYGAAFRCCRQDETSCIHPNVNCTKVWSCSLSIPSRGHAIGLGRCYHFAVPDRFLDEPGANK